MMTCIPQTLPYTGRLEKKYVYDVLKRRWFTEGKYSKRFIELIKKKTNAEYVFPAPNGTLAIYLSLLAVGVKPGDSVIVPDFTFNATASPLYFIGATPRFVDVKPDTLNIDTSKIEEQIDESTSAIIPVHIFGQSAEMKEIVKIARKHDLKIVEDAAQAYGAYHWYNNLYEPKNQLDIYHVGTMGDIGIISFYADKSVTAGGEGAAVLTNDAEIAHRVQVIRNQGRISSGTFIHDELGMNFRMTDLQCAVGCAQLEKFEKIEKKKSLLWMHYTHRLLDTNLRFLKTGNNWDNIVPFRFPIRTNTVMEKTRVMKQLESMNIQTRGFFMPLHMQPCWSHLGYSDKDYPVSIDAYNTGICLPIYPSLTKNQVDIICSNIIYSLKPTEINLGVRRDNEY